MADNKKYYYIRLKDNFFDSDEIVLLESMQDGYLYSNILLKLYLRSLKDNGRLMFNDRIPYNPQMIATITRHQVGTVEKALRIFVDMGLIEILDNGAIYMLDIQQYIGKSSTEADRRREYDRRIKSEKILECEKSHEKPHEKSTPEIEIKKELYLDIKKDTHTSSKNEVDIEDEFKELWDMYPNKKGKTDALKHYQKARTRKKSPVSFETVKSGIVAYNFYIKKTKTELKYVKHGSTWFNQECWNDDYTVIEKQKKGVHTLKNGVETSNPFIAMIDESEE